MITAEQKEQAIIDLIASRKPLLIAYILTMPNRGSWDGRWSGEKNLYAVIKRYTTKSGKQKAVTRVGKYHYRWSDGWGANVQCKIIDAVEARKMRKASKGFCNYEWMIEEIERYGRIRPEIERYAR